MIPLRIEGLERTHRIDAFDCGNAPLNRFLARHALQSQQSGASRTYVALVGPDVVGMDEVVGYYTLVVGQVAHEEAPERLKKGLARHPVPLMLLARLAIAEAWKGRGLGSGLLKDAMLRTLQAAGIAGIRAFAAHAKDDAAKAFYEHFDFVPSPSDPYHLFLLLKDIPALLRR